MSDRIEISGVFDGDKSEQQNALITALTECGKDFAKKDNRHPHDNSLYDWMEKTQKKALIVGIVDKLNELGYEIVKTIKPDGK
jgi:predicted hydrocarbon binding protein